MWVVKLIGIIGAVVLALAVVAGGFVLMATVATIGGALFCLVLVAALCAHLVTETFGVARRRLRRR